MASVSSFEQGAAAPMIDHPAFGLLRATPSRVGQPWLWQSLDLIETTRGEADVAFEAGAEGPGEAHRAQLREIVSSLDALTQAAAPLIYDRLFGRAATRDASAELEWCGVCLTGRPGEFQLEFSCSSRTEAIAVRFERSLPVGAQIEV
jgi:hypothetical protein